MKLFNKVFYLYQAKKLLILGAQEIHTRKNDLFCIEENIIIYGFFTYNFVSCEYQIYANSNLNIRGRRHYIDEGIQSLYNDLMSYFHQWNKGKVTWEIIDLYEAI